MTGTDDSFGYLAKREINNSYYENILKEEYIMFKKNFRDIAVTALALGTAYGLGILSCVYYEIKLFVDVCEATKKEEKEEHIVYKPYNKHRE